MTYSGHVVGGVIVLAEGHSLPEGATVQIALVEPVIPSQPKNGHGAAPSLEERIARIAANVPIEDWESLPADLSDQIDHYVHGLPKR